MRNLGEEEYSGSVGTGLGLLGRVGSKNETLLLWVGFGTVGPLFPGAELGRLGSCPFKLNVDSVIEDLEFLRAGWSSRSGGVGCSSIFSSWRLLILLLSFGRKKSRFDSRSSVYGGGCITGCVNSGCDFECLTFRCSFDLFLRTAVEHAWPIFAIGLTSSHLFHDSKYNYNSTITIEVELKGSGRAS
jgi:hypothetical protein